MILLLLSPHLLGGVIFEFSKHHGDTWKVLAGVKDTSKTNVMSHF